MSFIMLLCGGMLPDQSVHFKGLPYYASQFTEMYDLYQWL